MSIVSRRSVQGVGYRYTARMIAARGRRHGLGAQPPRRHRRGRGRRRSRPGRRGARVDGRGPARARASSRATVTDAAPTGDRGFEVRSTALTPARSAREARLQLGEDVVPRRRGSRARPTAPPTATRSRRRRVAPASARNSPVSQFCAGNGRDDARSSRSRASRGSGCRAPAGRSSPASARCRCRRRPAIARRCASVAADWRVRRNAVPTCTPDGAERERGGDAAPVGDPARRDHRHAHRVDDLRHERDRADERLLGRPQERDAVTGRLGAARDDRVHAAASSATASATVVAVPMTRMPRLCAARDERLGRAHRRRRSDAAGAASITAVELRVDVGQERERRRRAAQCPARRTAGRGPRWRAPRSTSRRRDLVARRQPEVDRERAGRRRMQCRDRCRWMRSAS